MISILSLKVYINMYLKYFVFKLKNVKSFFPENSLKYYNKYWYEWYGDEHTLWTQTLCFYLNSGVAYPST